MDARVSDKIIRNTAYNTAGRFWNVLVNIFLVPFIISHIGVEAFGVWAIVGVITGYFGLLDFGVGSSFVKYVSEFYARKEYGKINHIINTGFIFYSILGLCLITLAFLFADGLLGLFKIPPALHDEARFVFLTAVAVFCASNALGGFLSVQTGLQRMDVSNRIAVFLSIPNAIGTILFLKNGFGLSGLMVNNVVIFILGSIINITMAHRLLPEMRFNPLGWDRETFRKTFKFGYNMQISKISGIFSTQIDKILIAYFLSIGLVTFYQLGSSVVYFAMTIPALLVSALVPAFSEIEARGERAKLIDAYLRTSKYMTFLVAPLFIFLFVSAHGVMTLWMAGGYEKSAIVIQILSIAFLVNCIARIGSSVSMAIDRPQLMAQSSVITIALNVILSVVLIRLYGFFGAAWGTLFAVNIGTAYFLVRLHTALKTPARKLANAMLPYILAGLLAALAVLGVGKLTGTFTAVSGRMAALAILCAHAMVFSAVYLMAIYWLRPFDPVDTGFLKERFPFARAVIEKLYMP